MNIYKGLLFLDGFRIAAEDADDRPTAAAAPARPSAPARARPAAPRWRRALRGIAAFAGVLPVDPHPGGCG